MHYLLNLVEKKISKYICSCRRKEAKYYDRKLNINVNNLVSSTTYFPIDAAMRYVKDQSSFTPLLNVQILSNNIITQMYTKQFRPI